MIIKSESKTQSIRELGNFAIESGAMRFTDPCYVNDTWCKGSMPAMNGTWNARIGFFRDKHDEESLFNSIELLKQSVVYIENMKTLADLELLKSLRQSVIDQQKAANVFGGLPYTKVNYPDEAKELIADIVELTNTLKRPSWLEYENFVQNCIGCVLSNVTGSNHEMLDASFQMRLAMLHLKHTKKSVTDQETFEATQVELSQGAKLLLEKKVGAYDAGKPRRTHFLHVKHDSVPTYTSFDADVWTCNETNDEAFHVGVDSGQAGFFDEQWFTNYANTQKSDEKAWEETYEMLCCLSSGGDSYRNKNDKTKKEGGVCEFGANSYTAHGDGSAPLFYRTNDKGEVIEAIYHYDADWEEEDDVE